MDKLPSIDREEWRQLLTGEIDVPLENFVLQMKVTNTKNRLESKTLLLDNAVVEIYDLCKKFYSAKNMSKDIDKIFKIDRDNIPVESNYVLLEDFENLKVEFTDEIRRVNELSLKFLNEEFDKIYADSELQQKKANSDFSTLNKKMSMVSERLLKSENLNQELTALITDLKFKLEKGNKGLFSKMFNS